MQCQARIVREYKTRKADVRWPETVYGPVMDAEIHTLPVCGGDVTLKVEIEHSGCSCCSGPGQIVIVATCSRCKHPYVPGVLRFSTDAIAYLEELLNAQ